MDALYQEKILNWAKASRAQTPLSGDFVAATISNPTCGDRVEVRLHLDADHVITDASASVRGCALCEAGAGLFTSLAPGMTATALAALQTGFTTWLANDNGPDDGPDDGPANNSKNSAQIEPTMQDFTPVRAIKNRHKCVLLAFEAGTAALTPDE
jgi:nitrogen fixation NifU-like protein